MEHAIFRWPQDEENFCTKNNVAEISLEHCGGTKAVIALLGPEEVALWQGSTASTRNLSTYADLLSAGILLRNVKNLALCSSRQS
jgi:hypothetical protein